MIKTEPACTGQPRIGLLNLMPKKPEAEAQWARFGFSVPLKFDRDPRKGGSSADYLRTCTSVSQAFAEGLGGMVITGANLELADGGASLFPFRDISFYRQLVDVRRQAQDNVRLLVNSCLASHIALAQLCEGDKRELTGQKTFGVYEHEIVADHPLVDGLGDTITAPHSRWGNIPSKILKDFGIQVLAEHEDAGWLLAVREENGLTEVFIQGHPEYGRENLRDEFMRDGSKPEDMPYGYFPHNNPSQDPAYSWQTDSEILFGNMMQLAA